MEYEGKGGRNDYSSEFALKKVRKPKKLYLMCIECNYEGENGECICPKCNNPMWRKSTMWRDGYYP